ncbi:MAG: hypothetical protein RSC68_33995, partial [Acinetobacter sp.]
MYGAPTGDGVFSILQCGKTHELEQDANSTKRTNPADEAKRPDARKKPVHALPYKCSRAPLPRAAIATESKNPA